jgi:cytochrome c5
MNTSNKSNAPARTILAAVVAVALAGGLASTLCFADPPSSVATAPTNSVAPTASSTATDKAAARQALTGAELYSMHCNRCHPERYPTERTAAQWKTIMLHMQVRANIPAAQARLILKYLQENSGR